MTVLVDSDIMTALVDGTIVIEPYDRSCLGTNSYDVHLGSVLRTYADLEDQWFKKMPLDVREKRDTRVWPIPDAGLVLQPGELYLASTIEYTEAHVHVPIVNGKSSLGRLGLSVHVTAGTGDVGFCGAWTLELTVVKPLRVYAGMAVGQLLWFTASGIPEVPYGEKPTAKYGGKDPLPQASKMHLNFPGAK